MEVYGTALAAQIGIDVGMGLDRRKALSGRLMRARDEMQLTRMKHTLEKFVSRLPHGRGSVTHGFY